MPEGPEELPEGPEGLPEGHESLPKGPEGLPGAMGGTYAQKDGQMDGRTDGRMEFLPILQDFVPCWGCCPATLLRLHNIKEAGQGNR